MNRRYFRPDTPLILWVPLLLLACSLSGCGNSEEGPSRYVVTGTVTYDGKPVPRGYVTFVPDNAKGTTGPTSRAKIVDGKYNTQSEGSKPPIAGDLLIQIEGYGPEVPNEEFASPLFETYTVEQKLAPKNQELNIDVPKKK